MGLAGGHALASLSSLGAKGVAVGLEVMPWQPYPLGVKGVVVVQEDVP